jgi:hypothetical protein
MWASQWNRGNLPVKLLCTPRGKPGDKADPIGGLPACGKLWRMLAPARVVCHEGGESKNCAELNRRTTSASHVRFPDYKSI